VCSRRHLEFELMIMIACIMLGFPWQRHQDLPNDGHLEELIHYLGYGPKTFEMHLIPGILDQEKESDGRLRKNCGLTALKRFMTACNRRKGAIGGGQGGTTFLRICNSGLPRFSLGERQKTQKGRSIVMTQCCICLKLLPKSEHFGVFNGREVTRKADDRRCYLCVSISILFLKLSCIYLVRSII
jgi:hypothetical protein